MNLTKHALPIQLRTKKIALVDFVQTTYAGLYAVGILMQSLETENKACLDSIQQT